jgi:hypothetical protein
MILVKTPREFFEQLFVFFCVVFIGVVQLVLTLIDVVLNRLRILSESVQFNFTVNLGYNELCCYQTLGYNKQILKSNWSF